MVFPILIPSSFLFALIAIARGSTAILKINGDNAQPCRTPRVMHILSLQYPFSNIRAFWQSYNRAIHFQMNGGTPNCLVTIFNVSPFDSIKCFFSVEIDQNCRGLLPLNFTYYILKPMNITLHMPPHL